MNNITKKQTIITILSLAVAGALICFYAFSLKKTVRYAVFAGYNANGTIAPYVLTYLKGLNEVADGVVYIADSPLNPQEKQKLQGLVLHTEHQRHNEYDWGSYKRGFRWLKENGYLNQADEVIFANDSCYAPLHSFKPMFADMARRPELAFWGNSQNTAIQRHLQSYFLVFRKPVLRSKNFAAFLEKITHQEHQAEYIVKYETNLTPLLENLGYKWDSWLPGNLLPKDKDFTDVNNYPLQMLRDHNNQFLKRRTFTTNLAILDDRGALLRYIKQRYPARYKDIVREISPHFIPDDLKEKHNVR